MDLETFKQIYKGLPFWKKLKWFYWSAEKSEREANKIEWELYNGASKDVIEYREKESKAQFERAKWLYSELIDMYEHERQMRIMYQKMAKK